MPRSSVQGSPAAGNGTELLGIDPMGYGRARLLYHATFLVETRGRKEGWKVVIDAVTGELLNSESTFKQ